MLFRLYKNSGSLENITTDIIKLRDLIKLRKIVGGGVNVNHVGIITGPDSLINEDASMRGK